VETQPVADAELQAELARDGLFPLPSGLMVFEIAGPMFFGAVEHVERALAGVSEAPAALVIRLRRVPFMDITGIQTLDGVIGKLRRRGVIVMLCEANERVAAKLSQAGVMDDAPGGDHALPLPHAVRSAAARMAAAAEA
jgi:SulP family sulfate permease